MPELVTRRAADVRSNRVPWEGLGDHGFAYMDSEADTGGTLVPRLSRMAGGTGTFGDPRWETVAGTAEDFVIFARAASDLVVTTVRGIAERDLDLLYDWDLVTITPLRIPLRRPDVTPSVASPQVALEDVLTRLRAQAGLPVGDLAAMLGVSRRQFYNWVARENDPDTDQEQRIRRSASLVASLEDRFGDPRTVRAALLATTQHGSAFDALKAGDLEQAEAALAIVTAEQQPLPDVVARSRRRSYDRERVLLELEHLRDVPRQGDG